MSTLYPAAIDGYSQIRVLRDRIDEVVAKDHNDARSAIVAIETALGVSPQGGFGTVAARLDDSYSNLANHVSGGIPRHTDDVINASAKSGTPLNLSFGTVQDQLTSLLASVNSTSVFLGLTDTPSSYDAYGGKSLRVNSGATAVEFFDPTFLNLADTPSTFTAGLTLKVNSGGTGVEYYTPSFLGLSETPSSFSGEAGKIPSVNSGETALEFIDPPTGVFIDLSDVDPTSYSGSAGFFVKVNATETGLEFGTTGAVSINFKDLSDTPSTYVGAAGKIASINDSETGVETRVELPTEFLRRAFDSFVVDGFDAYQDGATINSVLSPGTIVSNGRVAKISTYTNLVTPVISGDYYIAIKFDPGTDLPQVIGPLANPLSVIGDSNETTVLLKKFTHNGSTWTDSVDLRRYGMLSNNKNFFTVGNNANVPDGYGADFTSIKSAVEHVRVLDSIGSPKMAPKKILVVDDLTISSSTEVPISLDIEGISIDGGGRKITSTINSALFEIEADHVRVSDVRFDLDISTTGVTAFANVGASGSVDGVHITGNTMTYSGSVPARSFVMCGDASGVNRVTNCIFSNNIAYVNDFGIVPANQSTQLLSRIIEDSIVDGNTIHQETSTSSANASGVYVSHNCVVDGNIIEGGFIYGVVTVGENVIVSDNFINGGTGTALSVGVPVMNVGVDIWAPTTGDSMNCIVSGNTIKGITLHGIRMGASNTIISNNFITNQRDVGGLLMIGINDFGGLANINNNYILSAGSKGISANKGSSCTNNFIYESQTTLSSAIAIADTAPVTSGVSVSGNFILDCYGSGIDGAELDFSIVERNHISGVAGSSVTGILNTGSYCIVSNNIIKNYGASSGFGISGGDGVASVFAYNSILAPDSTMVAGIQIHANGDRDLVIGNRVGTDGDGVPGYGIDMQNTDQSVISWNYIFGQAAGTTLHAITDIGDNSLVSGNFIQDSNGSGIRSEGNKVSVVSNYVEGSGYIGVYVASSNTDNLISSNYVVNPASTGIAALNATSRIIISGNYVYSPSAYGIAAAGNQSIVSNNSIYNPTDGIILSNSYDRTMVGSNYIYSPSGVGIRITTGVSNLLVNGNFIYDATNQGILMESSAGDYSIISNNFIDDCDGGISIETGATGHLISGNLLRNLSANSTGIDVDGNLCIISNNSISSDYAFDYGIRFYQNDALVIGNHIDGADVVGIYSDGGSYSSIVGNYVRYGSFGIYFYDEDHMLVANNLLVSVDSGVYADNSDNVTIVGNYINGVDASASFGIQMGIAGRWFTIVGNRVQNFYYNIDMRGDYCMCVGNRASESLEAAIFMNSSQRSLCTGNYGVNNSKDGITILSCYACVVSANYMECSTGYEGLESDASPNRCIIRGNMVRGGNTPSGFGTLTTSTSYSRVGNYRVT